jgi:hypothetical protein
LTDNLTVEVDAVTVRFPVQRSLMMLTISMALVIVLAAGLPANTATMSSNSTTEHHSTSITVTEGVTFTESVSRTPFLALDEFSARVLGYCIPAAIAIFFGTLAALTVAKKPVRVSLSAAVFATFAGVFIILIIVGAASQLVIPFLRSLASGSQEQGVLLSFATLVCLVCLALILLPRKKGTLPPEPGGIQVNIMGDSNVVKVGNVEIKEPPPIQPAPNAKVSHLTAEPPIFVKGLLNISGQVNTPQGDPAPYALVQFYVSDGNQWSPYRSPFPTGSDGRFLANVAPSPPIAIMPVVTEYVDVRLTSDDFKIRRSSSALAKNLSGSVDLLFQNCGNVETSLFPIDWEIEPVPDLSITLEPSSRTIQNIRPNTVFPLKLEITLRSEKFIASVLDALGQSVRITIRYRFSVPRGETASKQAALRVLLTD